MDTTQRGASLDRGTAYDAVHDYARPESATAALALKARWLRDEVESLHGDAKDLHHRARQLNMKDRTATKVRRSVPELLRELAMDRGMAWADIAELVGVSVAAIRKWRTDGGATGRAVGCWRACWAPRAIRDSGVR